MQNVTRLKLHLFQIVFIARSLALKKNDKRVRKVIVYYSTPFFSLSVWDSRTRPSFHSFSTDNSRVSIARGGSSRGAAGLQPSLKNVRQKIPQTAKLALSLDLVAKFHITIIFGTSDTILAQRFLGIQQNQCFALFPTTPLMR